MIAPKDLRAIRDTLGRKGMALYARAEAVEAIDNELRKCPDNLRDLLIAARELTLGGAPASVTLPLLDRYRNALPKNGKKPRPLLDRAHLTGLVAVVDLIRGGGGA